MDSNQKLLRLAAAQGILRAKDIESIGLTRVHLQRLTQAGLLERVSRGIYRLPERETDAPPSIAHLSAKIPNGVVCLLSALHLHGLTTQLPREWWVAVPTGSRVPSAAGLPLRFVRMASAMHRIGVEEKVVAGVRVRVHDLEKSVVDCFRWRHRLGLDVALEAIREYARISRPRVRVLMHYAEVCRVARAMRPYLDAIA